MAAIAELDATIELACIRVSGRSSRGPDRQDGAIAETHLTGTSIEYGLGPPMTTRVKWTAQLDQVQEVSLLGTADLHFWQERLTGEGLSPVNRGGRAAILVVSAAGRYMGIRFREMSISVIVSSAEVTSYFLLRAFNSNRFFAFCERVFFSTPYEGECVDVVPDIPAAISVGQHDHTAFHASMHVTDRLATRTPNQEYEEALLAQILLPCKTDATSRQAKMFFARIRGTTKIYPFLAGRDIISIDSRTNGDVFHTLSESNFVPEEWIVRLNAFHAKSKTYARNAAVEFERNPLAERS
jgi:hypothetical protein